MTTETITAPTRVRLTATRIRNLDNAIVAVATALTRVDATIDLLLEGREDDNSPAVNAIRDVRALLAGPDPKAALGISSSLVATFNAFL